MMSTIEKKSAISSQIQRRFNKSIGSINQIGILDHDDDAKSYDNQDLVITWLNNYMSTYSLHNLYNDVGTNREQYAILKLNS